MITDKGQIIDRITGDIVNVSFKLIKVQGRMTTIVLTGIDIPHTKLALMEFKKRNTIWETFKNGHSMREYNYIGVITNMVNLGEKFTVVIITFC